MSISWEDFSGFSLALKEELRSLIEDVDIKADFIIDDIFITKINVQGLLNNVVTLRENVEQLTHNSNLLIVLSVIGIVTTTALGVAILINQHKIKKQLQELLDQKDDMNLTSKE